MNVSDHGIRGKTFIATSVCGGQREFGGSGAVHVISVSQNYDTVVQEAMVSRTSCEGGEGINNC